MCIFKPKPLFEVICNKLVPLYQNAFSVNLSHYDIRNDTKDAYAPITRRSKNEIVLNCNMSCACQIAFQLSHELCHAAIPNDVNNNLRWFEETLAVLSSYFFPMQLFCVDSKKYSAYFCFAYQELSPLCKTDPMVLDNETLLFLQSGSGTSNYNDYGSYREVAEKILPTVKQSPDFWKCVPCMCNVPSGLSFFDSIEEWKSLAPSDVSNVISVVISALLLR